MPTPEIVPAIAGVRSLLYDTARLEESGSADAAPGDVQGVVVEIAMDGSVVILAGYADGSSRLFLGRGGGVIGKIEDFPPETLAAARRLVSFGAACSTLAVAEKQRRWPPEGAVRVALLSRQGVTTFERKVVALANDKGPAGKLWISANALLEHLLVFMDGCDDEEE